MLIFAVMAVVITGPARAQVPMQQYDTTLKQMLDAVQSTSYDQFLLNGDARFREGFTQKKFEDLSRQLGPRLQQGYYVAFLTTLRQRDYIVYLWKIVFKDAKDDILVNMAIRDGHVIGFIIR